MKENRLNNINENVNNKKANNFKLIRKMNLKSLKLASIGTMACVLVSGVGLSTAAVVNTINRCENQISSIANTYYYKKGEIRFDASGKILVPKVIDNENPFGLYQYHAKQIPSINIDNSEWNDNDFAKRTESLLKRTKEQIFKQKGFQDKTPFKVNKNLKMLIDNFIPNNNIKLDSTTNMNEMMLSLYDSSLEEHKLHTYSSNQIKDMLAICGINFDKEFNDLTKKAMENINKKQQAKPSNFLMFSPNGFCPYWPIPGSNNMPWDNGYYNDNKYNPPVAPPNFDDPKKFESYKLSVKEYVNTVLKQNEKYQKAFFITYSTVLPILCIAETVAVGLALFSFGATAFEIASLIIDITFAGLEIHYSYVNWDSTYNLIKDIDDSIESYEKFKQNMKKYSDKSPVSLNALNDMNDYWGMSAQMVEIIDEEGELSQFFHHFKIASKIDKSLFETMNIASNIAGSSVSIFSFLFGQIMNILEDQFIHYPGE